MLGTSLCRAPLQARLWQAPEWMQTARSSPRGAMFEPQPLGFQAN
jgi:hypothetical protein